MMLRWTVGVFFSLLISLGWAEPLLYETGPATDSSFVRFVSATVDALNVQTEMGGKIQLSQSRPDTGWIAVKANTQLKARVLAQGKQRDVMIKLKPGEFSNVLVTALKNGNIDVSVTREQPSDFSAYKVALAIVNANSDCKNATLKLAGKNVVIFDSIAVGQMQRRMVNPVTLNIDLYCAGNIVQKDINVGLLSAGDRRTIFVVPSQSGVALLPILDRMP